MKVGILGGTFNPIHLGHLSIAKDVKQLLQLDSVIFVPAKNPPLKTVEGFSPEARYKFVAAAIKNEDGFEISDVEFKRSGPSYSVTTLKEIALQKKLSPQDLFFIMGSDSLSTIKSWWRYEELFTLANIIVVTRAGCLLDMNYINTIAQELGFCYNEVDDRIKVLGSISNWNDTQKAEVKEKQNVTSHRSTKQISYSQEEFSGSHSDNSPYKSRNLPSSNTENLTECRSIKHAAESANSTKESLPRMLKIYTSPKALSLYLVAANPLLISSSDIRSRLSNNEDLTDLVPSAVINLIKEEDTST